MHSTTVTLSPATLAALNLAAVRARCKPRDVLEVALLLGGVVGDLDTQVRIAAQRSHAPPEHVPRTITGFRISPALAPVLARVKARLWPLSAWADHVAAEHAAEAATVIAEFTLSERRLLEAAALALPKP